MNVSLMPSLSRRWSTAPYQPAKFNFAQPQMAVVVAHDFAETLQLAFGQRSKQPFSPSDSIESFGENHQPVLRPVRFALDDGANDDVATSSTVTGRPRNSSEMTESVAAEALAMPSARCPAARPMLDNEIPARRRSGVFNQVAD